MLKVHGLNMKSDEMPSKRRWRRELRSGLCIQMSFPDSSTFLDNLSCRRASLQARNTNALQLLSALLFHFAFFRWRFSIFRFRRTYANHRALVCAAAGSCVWGSQSIGSEWGVQWGEWPPREKSNRSEETLHAAFHSTDEAHQRKYRLPESVGRSITSSCQQTWKNKEFELVMLTCC